MCKKIVYTTIAENLIQRNIKIPQFVIEEIKDSYFDNSQFELSDEEYEILSDRIAKVHKELDVRK